MSAQRISLNSKPVIVGVLVLLAVVAAVNIAVFKPGRSLARRAEVRVQASQPLPADLGELRRDDTLSRRDLARWAAGATPALVRDPFGSSRTRNEAPPVAEEPREDPQDGSGPREPVCEAIFLGGGQPSAVINGQRYQVGDTFEDYQVAAIGNLGVKLTQVSGPARFLSVYSDRGSGGRSHIITNSSGIDGLDGTSLLDHAEGERK